MSFRLTSVAFAAFTLLAANRAQAVVKVACAGEQTTHSAHRENDPEYPLLMAQGLDPGFVPSDKMALLGGGFQEGAGPLFAVGNFAHPQGSVLNHDQENPKTYLKSNEYQQLVLFQPDLVVLGPFAWHDVLSGVPLSNFSADLDALIAALQALDSKPRVALATPVPEGGADKADGFTEINGFTKAAATGHQLPLIDVWTEMLGKTTLYQDDFHLTLEGRQHLADFIGGKVEALAAEPPAGAGGAGGMAGMAGSGGAAGSDAASGGAGTPAASAGNPSAGSSVAPSAGNGGGVVAAAGSSDPGLMPQAPAEASGCGCRVPAGHNAGGAAALVLGLALVGRRRARHK